MSKERMVNAGWTVGAVVVGVALYEMFGRALIARLLPRPQVQA